MIVNPVLQIFAMRLKGGRDKTNMKEDKSMNPAPGMTDLLMRYLAEEKLSVKELRHIADYYKSRFEQALVNLHSHMEGNRLLDEERCNLRSSLSKAALSHEILDELCNGRSVIIRDAGKGELKHLVINEENSFGYAYDFWITLKKEGFI